MTTKSKCGGDVLDRDSALWGRVKAGGAVIRHGNVVPCPHCGKAIKLRLPFNSNAARVQIPLHGRAA